MEYQKVDYSGTHYYALHEDYQSPLKHPLRNYAGPLNRIAVQKAILLAAPATDLISELIDVQQKRSDSLQDSKPHMALANALGPDVLSGVFAPQAVINSPGPGFSAVVPGELEEYIGGSDKWGYLSHSDMIFMGYRVMNGLDQVVIDLYYPDPNVAEKDRAELNHHWATLKLIQYWDPEAQDFPVTRACDSFSTEVMKWPDFSVLLGICDLKTESPDTDSDFLESPSLWQYLRPWLLAENLEDLNNLRNQVKPR